MLFNIWKEREIPILTEEVEERKDVFLKNPKELKQYLPWKKNRNGNIYQVKEELSRQRYSMQR